MKPYEGKEPYIFISYAHADSDRVLPVLEFLSQKGFRIWYDAGIEAGSEWPAYIEEHLSAAGAVLVFMSSASGESRYCKREIYCADELKKDILVVYLEEVSLEPGLRFILRPLQAVFRSQFASDTAFAEALAEAKLLQSCRGAVGAAIPDDSPEALVARAERGDAEAMFALATAFNKGEGAEKDPVQALFWYRKAADLGHAEAEFQIATHYEKGTVVAKDLCAAFEWHCRAAEKGHPQSAYFLGNYYRNGPPAIRDDATALRWYRMAAEGGDFASMSTLAYFYQTGILVPRDPVMMLYWYRKGAESGDCLAALHLADCYRDGVGVKVDDNEALFWYRKAAELTPYYGLAMLGRFYEKRGRREEAIRAYRESLTHNPKYLFPKNALKRLGVSETE